MKIQSNNLNKLQKKAVLTTEGPLIIIAGAGSGKTRLLTHRIAYLIKRGVHPSQILSITFTNKAAQSMKNQILNLIGELEINYLWIGTFHSIFLKILRKESNIINYSNNFIIYDIQDSINIVKKIVLSLNLDIDIYKAQELQKRISMYKNNFITPNSYFENLELIKFNSIIKIPEIGKIYQKYCEICFKNNAMDFDDLLLKSNEIFTKNPEILLKYQNQFHYILVDEYQDTNYIQYLIIKLLALKHQNICVIGDDAQSIYSFRGANIHNILNFQKDYPNAKKITLEQNYRSTKIIVDAANNIISNNKEQFTKNVWTLNPIGELIMIYKALSPIDEANFIINSIIKLKNKKKISNKDCLILYRTNAQSKILEEILIKKTIPYKIFGNVSFYQKKEIKKILCYLRVLINPNDNESILEIINFPSRGIGSITINKIIFFSKKMNLSIYQILLKIDFFRKNLGLKNEIISKLYIFYKLIEKYKIELKNNELYKIVINIIEDIKLIENIKKKYNNESNEKINLVYEFINNIKNFSNKRKNIENNLSILNSFMENVILINEIENKININKDFISLMTIHLSKGLEFPYVYIAGMEEGLFPNIIYNNNLKKIEEERRLFYVALTRAEKQVFISFSKKRLHWGKIINTKPSRFLKEINKKYIKYLNQ